MVVNFDVPSDLVYVTGDRAHITLTFEMIDQLAGLVFDARANQKAYSQVTELKFKGFAPTVTVGKHEG